MTERLSKIFSELGECKVFADIGCDHGYVAKAMLESGKAEHVIIADVSKPCLEKAQNLLKEEIEEKKVTAVVSDGFEKVVGCDLALIAGMGGEEIIGIMERAKNLPERLVLQPMKNCDKVRLHAVKAGYKLKKDYVFFSADKFYNLLVLERGRDSLTEEEIEFGRDNLNGNNQDFKLMLMREIRNLTEYSQRVGLSQEAFEKMSKRINRLKKYVN